METGNNASAAKQGNGRLAGVGQCLLRILGFFVILEPIWMLLPFAGFLYGSGLQIQNLARHPHTAWLTHFVFPVLTLGMTGPVLVVMGFLVFLVGAGQIYSAKLFRKGMVTGGLYAFVRHPQYTALTLFGLGLLLAWGRAMMFLAFFVMMYLYYFLAKSEERKCIELFGEQYEAYRRRTSCCIPGDRVIGRLLGRLPMPSMPRPLAIASSFVLTMLLAFSLMWLITTLRIRARIVPFMTTTVVLGEPDAGTEPSPALTEGRTAGISFVTSGQILVVRGPWRNAAAPGFAETVLRRSLRSPALGELLAFPEEASREVAIMFCAPYTPPENDDGVGKQFMPQGGKRRGPVPDPDGPDRARIMVMRCELADGATITDALSDKSRRRILKAAMTWVDVSSPETEDIVVKGPNAIGRPGAPLPEAIGEERWDYLIAQIDERESLVDKPPATPSRPVAQPSPSTELILVQAPILRTRIEPGALHQHVDTGGKNLFAMDIRDRLAASPSFRERLKRCGVGAEIVPVAFPRPGPNWYREHHVRYKATEEGDWQSYGTKPQVSVFVMLVRIKPGLDYEALFDATRRSERTIQGAFIADVDFAIQPPADSVHEITIVGPRRDLEERWKFFLSGL